MRQLQTKLPSTAATEMKALAVRSGRVAIMISNADASGRRSAIQGRSELIATKSLGSGSARVSRAGCGVPPQRTFLSRARKTRPALFLYPDCDESLRPRGRRRQHSRRVRYPEFCVHISSKFQGADVLDVRRAACAIERDDNRETDCHLGGADGNDEQNENLPMIFGHA
jgi:hypothetical protein